MSNDKCGGGGTVRCGSVREDAGGNKAGRGETVEVHRGRGEAVETNRGRGGAVEPDRDEAESRLAVRILEACRNQLFFRQRFLEQALFRLEWKEANDIYFGSDGKYLYYKTIYSRGRTDVCGLSSYRYALSVSASLFLPSGFYEKR